MKDTIKDMVRDMVEDYISKNLHNVLQEVIDDAIYDVGGEISDMAIEYFREVVTKDLILDAACDVLTDETDDVCPF